MVVIGKCLAASAIASSVSLSSSASSAITVPALLSPPARSGHRPGPKRWSQVSRPRPGRSGRCAARAAPPLISHELALARQTKQSPRCPSPVKDPHKGTENLLYELAISEEASVKGAERRSGYRYQSVPRRTAKTRGRRPHA